MDIRKIWADSAYDSAVAFYKENPVVARKLFLVAYGAYSKINDEAGMARCNEFISVAGLEKVIDALGKNLEPVLKEYSCLESHPLPIVMDAFRRLILKSVRAGRLG